jgi:hypothetical protein
MAATTLSCPECGLTLTFTPSKRGGRFSYDVKEWKRRCKYPSLDSPVHCIIQTLSNPSRSTH